MQWNLARFLGACRRSRPSLTLSNPSNVFRPFHDSGRMAYPRWALSLPKGPTLTAKARAKPACALKTGCM
jgi:hypothetical protein